MRPIVPGLLVLTALPPAEDPWPDAIGIGTPFTMAVAGGVLVTLMRPRGPKDRRDEAILRGSRWGFYAGAFLYLLSLLNQLTFNR